MRKERWVIGLTGGIGSGKSTVANMFKHQNVPVLDTDRIAREVSKESSVQAKIIERFGKKSVKNGALNRSYLASIIFTHADKRKALNDIMHPLIKQELLQQLGLYQKGLIVVDVPLMYETDFHTLMDKIIVVYVTEDEQVHRLMWRDHLSEETARMRVAAQMPLAEKVKKADYVLDNSGSEAALATSFQKLYKTLMDDWQKGEKENANGYKSQ